MKAKNILFTLCFILIFAAAAVYVNKNSGSHPTDSNKKILIYTSIYPMYDFAKNVCGESAQIKCIVPNGTDFREWSPSDEDIEKIKSADMFIYSGKGAEPWIDQILSNLQNTNISVVHTSKNIFEESQSGFVWLNPHYAISQMTEIYNAVAEKDPQNKTAYSMNINICKEKIEKLDKIYREQISALPDKNIYVTAKIFDSLCNAYGLSQMTVDNIGYQGGVDFSHLDTIRQTLISNNIKCIYTEPQNNTYSLKELVMSTQTNVGALDPFVINLDNNGYFNTMENNLLSLKKGQMPALTKSGQ